MRIIELLEIAIGDYSTKQEILKAKKEVEATFSKQDIYCGLKFIAGEYTIEEEELFKSMHS